MPNQSPVCPLSIGGPAWTAAWGLETGGGGGGGEAVNGPTEERWRCGEEVAVQRGRKACALPVLCLPCLLRPPGCSGTPLVPPFGGTCALHSSADPGTGLAAEPCAQSQQSQSPAAAFSLERLGNASEIPAESRAKRSINKRSALPRRHLPGPFRLLDLLLPTLYIIVQSRRANPPPRPPTLTQHIDTRIGRFAWGKLNLHFGLVA
ncbi:hypothetical protein MAPG_02733 [Magnaporthiopsis poae ATCC 64411]|uniref:Uncharacterized protein n=1 Tax=Magnaporthiopsis poae (strain ATCC 64411 / 73-15) TaxID=644358 RepID=A0A0C4DS57_MAGP6|nr:hypothetical protein MAPG_02733 [Magnaporthiopsis poae ATCC 64411]